MKRLPCEYKHGPWLPARHERNIVCSRVARHHDSKQATERSRETRKCGPRTRSAYFAIADSFQPIHVRRSSSCHRLHREWHFRREGRRSRGLNDHPKPCHGALQSSSNGRHVPTNDPVLVCGQGLAPFAPRRTSDYNGRFPRRTRRVEWNANRIRPIGFPRLNRLTVHSARLKKRRPRPLSHSRFSPPIVYEVLPTHGLGAYSFVVMPYTC